MLPANTHAWSAEHLLDSSGIEFGDCALFDVWSTRNCVFFPSISASNFRLGSHSFSSKRYNIGVSASNLNSEEEDDPSKMAVLKQTWQRRRHRQCHRVFIVRLRALGCMIEIGPAHRQQDLVAAIINTQEYAPSRLGRSRGVCPSPRPAESKGRSAHHCAPPSPREEPASSTPAGTTALVAFDSAADPVKMGRKLARGWAKRWLKFCKKKEKKQKMQRIQGAIQSAWEEHGATMTVGDMRALVGHTLGLSLDDTEYRVRFDKALSRITSPPPQRRRKRCRFTIASNGARHQKKKHITP